MVTVTKTLSDLLFLDISRGLGGYRKENSHQPFFSTQRTAISKVTLFTTIMMVEITGDPVFLTRLFVVEGQPAVGEPYPPGAAVFACWFLALCLSHFPRGKAMIFLYFSATKKTIEKNCSNGRS